MERSKAAGIGVETGSWLEPGDIPRVEECGAVLTEMRQEIARRIVGQDQVVEELLISLLAEGHCLIIGVPGLAKTLLVRTVAELLSLTFKRIQFTPDLMPSDITGTTLIGGDLSSGDKNFRFLKGPIFANVLLADEINRTPPKTQAALMEAMEERQVTVAGVRHPLERPFFVLATQNPVEQEGTYPLPVSQLDRFLFNVLIDYPSAEEEFVVMERTTSAYQSDVRCLVDEAWLLEALSLVRRIDISYTLLDYATRIVRASRPAHSDSPAFVREWVAWGGGPRTVQSIILGAKSRALLHGRPSVQPEDIHRVVFPALRHRILLNYHGEAEGISPDLLIEKILLQMPEGLYQNTRAAPVSSWSRRWSLFSRLFRAK